MDIFHNISQLGSLSYSSSISTAFGGLPLLLQLLEKPNSLFKVFKRGL